MASIDSARYTPGNANSLLKLALITAWGEKCYRCGKYKAFSDLEIDHILAYKTSASDLRTLLEFHGVPRPEAFNVHDPQNLAPICRKCNRDKSDDNLPAGSTTTELKTARGHAGKVAATVRAFKGNAVLAKSLVALVSMNTRTPADRGVLEELGDLIVGKICQVNLPAVQEECDVDMHFGQMKYERTDDTRALQFILSQTVKIQLEDLLVELASQVSDFLYEGDLADALSQENELYDNVGEISVDHFWITVRTINWSKDGSGIECSVNGAVTTDGNAHILRAGQDGELVDFTASLRADVEFAGFVSFDTTHPGQNSDWEITITDKFDITADIE